LVTSALTTELVRRAGLIGVDAAVGVTASRFNNHSSENFRNPNISLDFNKQSGRTTGSVKLSAARENRADPDANLRYVAWNYNAGLNVRYQVIDRYYLTSSLSTMRKDYSNDRYFVDLTSYSFNTDLFYILNSERDLSMGYRYRLDDLSNSTYSADHGLNFGLRGKLLPKLNGMVTVGFQNRRSHGSIVEVFNTWTSSATLTWKFSRRITITGLVAKDFNTTSTGATTDGLTSNIMVSYIMSPKWVFSSGFGGGSTSFLGVKGGGRSDLFFNYRADILFTLSEHFKASLAYTFIKNWSSASLSDFVRNSFTLTFVSRW
jgi:hypothetical protein